MNKAGRLIWEKRRKLKWSLEELAYHLSTAGLKISAATVWRLEVGKQIPSDKQAGYIAAVLDLDAIDLKSLCDEDRKARSYSKTLRSSGGFFDLLDVVDDYIAQSERLRVNQPYLAIPYIDNVIEQLQTLLSTAGPRDRPAIRRLLAKALITRAFSYTMLVDREEVRGRLDRLIHLDEISGLSRFLREDDVPYPDMARILPAMVFYLTGAYQRQEEWLETHLPNITDPYMLSLGLRDHIVITSLMRDRDAYKQVIGQALSAGDSGLLDSTGRARILEGRVQALLRFSPQGAEQTLPKAENAMIEAEMGGQGYPFVRSQIMRTKLQFLVTHRLFDKDTILETARTSILLSKAGGFQRHFFQVKRILEEANLRMGRDFWAVT